MHLNLSCNRVGFFIQITTQLNKELFIEGHLSKKNLLRSEILIPEWFSPCGVGTIE